MTTDPETRNAAPRADNQDPALFGQTPSQTVGPYFHYGLPWKGGADLVGKSDIGARPDLFPERIVGWSSGAVPALEMDQSLPDYEI
jgi:protocatechuate 3,4-dioxygenase alpha subunit